MLIFFGALKLMPFGNQSLLNMDLWGQYFPMYSGFVESVREGSGLLWSWEGGFGFNEFAQNAYYCTGIFPIFLLLFPRSAMISGVTLLIVVKLALSSLSFSVFVRYKFGKLGAAGAAFSAAYALCAYTLAFITQPMWLDGVLFLPLIIVGLLRLMNEKKPFFYSIVLGLAVFSNFYIGYALCIFTGLFFVVEAISGLQKGLLVELLRSLGRFAAFSLLGVGLALFTLIPVVKAIGLTLASEAGFPQELELYHFAADFIKSLCIGQAPSLAYETPNIYSSLACAVFLPLFLFNGKIKLRRRIAYTVFIVFMFLSLNFNLLDYVWHGFHFPNQLPGRWSFALSFTMLAVSLEALAHLGSVRRSFLAIGCAAAPLLFTLFAFAGEKPIEMESWRVYLTVALLCAYAFMCVFIGVNGKRRGGQVCAYILAGVILAEAIANVPLTLNENLRITNGEYYTSKTAQTVAAAQKYKSSGTNFFRTEMYPNFTFNPGQLCGFNGISWYSSTMPASVFEFFSKLGLRIYAKNVSGVYLGPTAVTNSMFSLGYFFSQGADINCFGLEKIEEADGVDVYENKYRLPLGFLAREEILTWNGVEGDDLLNQNTLFAAASGAENVFTRLEPSRKAHENASLFSSGELNYFQRLGEGDAVMRFEYELEREDELVLSHKFKTGDIFVFANGSQIAAFPNTVPVFSLGHFAEGTEIAVEVRVKDENIGIGLYGVDIFSFDSGAFVRGFEYMDSSGFTLTDMGKSSMKASVSLAEDSIICTSVSNDGGWRVFCDGEELETLTAAGAWLAVHVPSGSHTLVFRYTVPGLPEGICLSVACAAALVVILWRKKKAQLKTIM